MAKVEEEVEKPVVETSQIMRVDIGDVVAQLRHVRRKRAYEKAMALRGKIHLDINIDELRGRNR